MTKRDVQPAHARTTNNNHDQTAQKRTRRAAFREADITRAVRGLRRAGEVCREVLIGPSGEIRILLGANNNTPDADATEEIATYFAQRRSSRVAA